MEELILTWVVFLGGCYLVYKIVVGLFDAALENKGFIGDIANIIRWLLRNLVKLLAIFLIVMILNGVFQWF